MKKQLISAVGVIYVHNLQSDTVEPNVLGEVFYMRKTRILKRRVRKVIYSLAVPLDGHSIDSVKQEMRELLDDTVKRYYEAAGWQLLANVVANVEQPTILAEHGYTE